jgi:hypothetical protein
MKLRSKLILATAACIVVNVCVATLFERSGFLSLTYDSYFWSTVGMVFVLLGFAVSVYVFIGISTHGSK